jgi:N-acyl-D-amino-acid deacylase
VFDPEALRETASYANPIATAEGFSFVLVNGVPVVADGRLTGELPGRALTKGRDGRSIPVSEHRPLRT